MELGRTGTIVNVILDRSTSVQITHSVNIRSLSLRQNKILSYFLARWNYGISNDETAKKQIADKFGLYYSTFSLVVKK
ncbi:hypothetical protein SAMN05421863_10426 [Nitrosomonas communis]|uniref:Uncharacterized protein n=1 Tax=Nitrosomonas communis TaxID=44574 RepID=A0A1I4SMU0_9PROT|nr:hypothetical protein SAMN05421863_10426 [Nitrosomonas communis]